MRKSKALKTPLLLSLIVFMQEGCSLPTLDVDSEVMKNIEQFQIEASTAADLSYSLNVLKAGDESMPRVIYVHGTPGTGGNWLSYLNDRVGGWEALAVDRPGFGESGPPGAVVRLEDQARAIEPLLVERRGVKPILVGHSLGGPIVTKVAAMYPDRVGAIVIAAGALDPELEKVLLIQHFGNTDLICWMLPRWARNSNRELIALEKELVEMEPQLAGIGCPILIVHGTADKLVPYENVAFMQEHFAANPLVETITLKDSNHFLIWNQSDKVREAITRAMELLGVEGVPKPTESLEEPAPVKSNEAVSPVEPNQSDS